MRGGTLNFRDSSPKTKKEKVGDDNNNAQQYSKLLPSHLQCTLSMEFIIYHQIVLLVHVFY
jgi:hypothetical protein